jgi:hypothetical protein
MAEPRPADLRLMEPEAAQFLNEVLELHPGSRIGSGEQRSPGRTS